MSNTDTSNPVVVRRCQQVKINGVRCGSPALKNQRLCYFHGAQLLSRPENRPCLDPYIDVPVLENDASIQVAITHIIRLLLSREIDRRTAALVLYGLQTSAAVARRGPIEPDPTDVVSDCMRVHKEPFTGQQDSIEPAKPQSVQQPAAESPDKAQEKVSDNAPPQPPRKPVVATDWVYEKDRGICLQRLCEKRRREAEAAGEPDPFQLP